MTGSVADGSGEGPDAVAVDPGNDNVYMANSVGNDLAVFDGATNTVTATIPVGADPDAVAVDTSTHAVYVVNGDDNTVSVIDESGDANTGKVVATVVSEKFPLPSRLIARRTMCMSSTSAATRCRSSAEAPTK